MTDLIRHITRAGHCRPLMALAFLLALGGTADRLSAAYGPLGGRHGSGPGLGLDAADRPTPARPSRNMDGHSRAVDESSICLSIPDVFQLDKGNGRANHRQAGGSVTQTGLLQVRALCSVSSSTALIDSSLGRRFTLVGSRPSGTG